MAAVCFWIFALYLFYVPMIDRVDMQLVIELSVLTITKSLDTSFLLTEVISLSWILSARFHVKIKLLRFASGCPRYGSSTP